MKNIYRFEEVEMLAQKICEVFSSKGREQNLKKEEAKKRHSLKKNMQMVLDIYQSIIDE